MGDQINGLENPFALMPPVVNHYHTTAQDNLAFPTSAALNETNYSIWAPLMKMRIGPRGKVDYLTGAKVAPDENSLEFETWAT
ncbi:hypothetical protein ACLB2K_073140 [Fragaria x ananassa]